MSHVKPVQPDTPDKMTCDTVVVVGADGPVRINATEYDASFHKLYSVEEKVEADPPKLEADPPAAEVKKGSKK